MPLIDNPLSAVAALAETAIKTIWPDKSAQEQQQLAGALALIQGQLDINRVEAASPSLLVSGWRPFLGWVCGSACAWNWLGLSVAKFVLAAAGHPLDMAPADLSQMWPLLLGMLGLGSMRTFEKLKGVA